MPIERKSPPRSMDEQVADWFAKRAAEDPVGELFRHEVLAGAWPDRGTLASEFGRVRRAFAASAREHEADGWSVGTTRMIRRSASGNWGLVQVEALGRHGALEVLLSARIWSALLLEVLDRRPVDALPSTGKVKPHLAPVFTTIYFTTRAMPAPPPPLTIPAGPRRWGDPQILLEPRTVRPWLDGLLERLAPEMAAWSADDRSLRDAMASLEPAVSTQLRRAAVLSVALGDDAALPDLVERARKAGEEEVTRGIGLTEEDRAALDRTRDIDLWSHERFMRFMKQELPRRIGR